MARNALVPEIAWADVDQALYGWDPSDGLMRLYRGEPLALDAYTETLNDTGLRRCRVVKDLLYEQLRAGATLILNRLELKSAAVGAITSSIGRFVGEKSVANGYVSFGGAGAFNKHWDTHDVFAVQLIGRKRWTVYRPTFELPLDHQRSLNHKQDCPSEPVFDGELRAGDVLYIPRGWWHATQSFDREETFHIAVGIHAPRLIDYAVWTCLKVLPQYVESRRSIKHEEESVDLARFVEVLQSQLLDGGNLNTFKAEVALEARSESEFDLGQLSPGAPSKRVGSATLNSPYRQQISSGKCVVNGFSLNLDEASSAALGSMFDQTGALKPVPIDERTNRLLCQLSQRDIVSIKAEPL